MSNPISNEYFSDDHWRPISPLPALRGYQKPL
jgi:hypothetical protein